MKVYGSRVMLLLNVLHSIIIIMLLPSHPYSTDSRIHCGSIKSELSECHIEANKVNAKS